MAASSSSGAAAVRRKIATLRSKIFQTAPPPPLNSPGGVRTGSKILKARLRGPSMLQYYPARLQLSSLKNVDFKDIPMFSNYDPTNTDFVNAALEESLPLDQGRGRPRTEEEGAEAAAFQKSQSPLPHGGFSTFETLGWSTGPLQINDEDEIQRLADNAARRARGKGPPKKAAGKRAVKRKGGKKR